MTKDIKTPRSGTSLTGTRGSSFPDQEIGGETEGGGLSIPSHLRLPEDQAGFSFHRRTR